MEKIPQFGLLTSPYNQLAKEIEFAGKLSFDFVEIAVQEPLTTPKYLEKNKERLKYLIKKYNLFFLAHAPLNTELGTSFEKIRFEWINLIKSLIRILSVLNAKKLNIHASFEKVPLKYRIMEKTFLDNCVLAFREIVEFGKKYKMQILLENGLRTVNDIRSIKYILDRVPDLGMTLDVAHAFILGKTNNIRGFIRTFRNRIIHCHMHDNHGKEDEHLPVGRGKINFIRVVKMLKEIDYNETITFEIFTEYKKGAKKSMEKIRKLWMKNNL